jgi:type II restriction/modification system DNA methylase subunit YeeA
MMEPLRREWADVKANAEELYAKIQAGAGKSAGRKRADSKERKAFEQHIQKFVERLAHVQVLDPACGSGNFLYVGINLLLDLEKEVITYASGRDLSLLPQVRPTQLHGLEINTYAAELAQVVIWIGFLQWVHFNGFVEPRDPLLQNVHSIIQTDSIIDLSDPDNPKEPEWPAAEFIVGNPPFLGDKKMHGELGDRYVESLRQLYEGRLPGQSDLCCYWFEKSRLQILNGKANRAGLLATQGIRGGANRTCLDRIKADGDIFWAYSDRDWILDGATVHVSMIGFDAGKEMTRELNGTTVQTINPDLTLKQAKTSSTF